MRFQTNWNWMCMKMSLYSLDINVVNNKMSEWMREGEKEIKLKRERIAEALLRISMVLVILQLLPIKRHYTLNLGTARAQTTSHTNPFGVSVVVGNTPAKCFQCGFDGKLTVFQNGNFFFSFVRFFNRSSCHCFWIHPKDNDTCLALQICRGKDHVRSLFNIFPSLFFYFFI